MEKVYQNIDKKQSVIWLIGRLVFLIIMVIVEMIYVSDVLDVNSGSDYYNLLSAINIVIIVLMCLQAVNTFIMPFLQRYFWKYRICDDKIEIYYGVIKKVTQVAPVARIQQVSLLRPFIERQTLTRIN